jgi:hypothetical protein
MLLHIVHALTQTSHADQARVFVCCFASQISEGLPSIHVSHADYGQGPSKTRLMHCRLIAVSLPKLELLALNVRHVTEPALVDSWWPALR